MTRETNPRNLSDHCVSILISERRCPMCLSELNSEYVCISCNYDALPWIQESRARHDAAHDRREG
jgi:hypothetical protein